MKLRRELLKIFSPFFPVLTCPKNRSIILSFLLPTPADVSSSVGSNKTSLQAFLRDIQLSTGLDSQYSLRISSHYLGHGDCFFFLDFSNHFPFCPCCHVVLSSTSTFSISLNGASFFKFVNHSCHCCMRHVEFRCHFSH